MDRLHTLMQRQDVLVASLPNIGSSTRAAFIAKGVLLEQDRIIALLEGTKNMTTIEGGQLVNYADHAIALIKGETE